MARFRDGSTHAREQDWSFRPKPTLYCLRVGFLSRVGRSSKLTARRLVRFAAAVVYPTICRAVALILRLFYVRFWFDVSRLNVTATPSEPFRCAAGRGDQLRPVPVSHAGLHRRPVQANTGDPLLKQPLYDKTHRTCVEF